MSGVFEKIRLYAHTLRYLKFRQVAYRLWYRIYRARPDLRAAPEPRLIVCSWQPYERARSMLAPEQFHFLNITRQLQSAGDWNHKNWQKLWLYNLHYFDDLNAQNANTRSAWHTALIQRWISENPPGVGNGWEPYPSSLRIVNWVQWGLTSGNDLDAKAMHSLAVQTRWVLKHLEYHLLGNHLWANAKALCFAGVLFQGPEAEHWLKKATCLIEAQLREQVLPDGGHFERSPMYHAIVLADVLDLIQLYQCMPTLFPKAFETRLQESAARMLFFLQAMTHPDGDIAFFNDATCGIAPKFSILADYAKALGLAMPPECQAISHFPDSGFVRLHNQRAVLLADIGSLGPRYIPGHAHAGTLSFELSVDAERQLVNTGISTYETGAVRLYQRGTAAHNTVKISAMDSSQVWSAFRVARRAKVSAVTVFRENAVLCLQAAHNGYRNLGVRHQRLWRLSETGLEIEDHCIGGKLPAVAYFHYAPGCQNLSFRSTGNLSVVKSTWCKGFNQVQDNVCMQLAFFGEYLKSTFHW